MEWNHVNSELSATNQQPLSDYRFEQFGVIENDAQPVRRTTSPLVYGAFPTDVPGYITDRSMNYTAPVYQHSLETAGPVTIPHPSHNRLQRRRIRSHSTGATRGSPSMAPSAASSLPSDRVDFEHAFLHTGFSDHRECRGEVPLTERVDDEMHFQPIPTKPTKRYRAHTIPCNMSPSSSSSCIPVEAFGTVSYAQPVRSLTPTATQMRSALSSSLDLQRNASAPYSLSPHLRSSRGFAHQGKLSPNVRPASPAVPTGTPMSPRIAGSPPTGTFAIAPQPSKMINPLPPAELHARLDAELLDVDFNDITVMELKQLLRARSLPSSGKKVLLVERLQEEIRLIRARREGNLKPEEDPRHPMYHHIQQIRKLEALQTYRGSMRTTAHPPSLNLSALSLARGHNSPMLGSLNMTSQPQSAPLATPPGALRTGSSPVMKRSYHITQSIAAPAAESPTNPLVQQPASRLGHRRASSDSAALRLAPAELDCDLSPRKDMHNALSLHQATNVAGSMPLAYNVQRDQQRIDRQGSQYAPQEAQDLDHLFMDVMHETAEASLDRASDGASFMDMSPLERMIGKDFLDDLFRTEDC
ncbi:hypothetical protein BC832DRAFT_541110 [Gaertneriomyces semiglobifer]|nr:hypothetical protein BC832DRAFT_541110 [Gaertneriomyces semiglobifer]